jgi:uncharacterized membrane protein
MKFRELIAYFGGTACASAFHEFGHHEVTISTVLAVITATGTLVYIVMGPKKPERSHEDSQGPTGGQDDTPPS